MTQTKNNDHRRLGIAGRIIRSLRKTADADVTIRKLQNDLHAERRRREHEISFLLEELEASGGFKVRSALKH